MEFMRAISVLFGKIDEHLLVLLSGTTAGNQYHVVDKTLANFNNTAGLFKLNLWTKILVVVFRIVLFKQRRKKRKKITWNKNIRCLILVYIFLSELVVAILTVTTKIANAGFYILLFCIFILLLDGRYMDVKVTKNNMFDYDVFNTENESFAAGNPPGW